MFDLVFDAKFFKRAQTRPENGEKACLLPTLTRRIRHAPSLLHSIAAFQLQKYV